MFSTHIIHVNGNTELNTLLKDFRVEKMNQEGILQLESHIKAIGWEFRSRHGNHFIFQHKDTKAVLVAFYFV